MKIAVMVFGICLCFLASVAPGLSIAVPAGAAAEPPAAVTPQSQTQDPHIADVISHIIGAYGGEKALRNARGYHESGEQLAVQVKKPIRVERWFGRPDRLRLELAYPDHHETRITDGAEGWTGSNVDSLERAMPMKLQAMRLQTARLDTPLRLLDHKDEIEMRDADPEGRTVLRVPIDTGLYIDYHVDLKTYQITRVTTGMTGPPAMEFAADYDQFRKIDGVLIAFKEVTYAGGTETSVFQITRFEWNPKNLDGDLRPGTRDSY